MKSEVNPTKFAIPAAAMTFLAPMASMAAEGTGRVSSCINLLVNLSISKFLFIFSNSMQAFGIDDGRLVWAALLPSFIIFPLYLGWAKQQEGEDFFDSYERRRSG